MYTREHFVTNRVTKNISSRDNKYTLTHYTYLKTIHRINSFKNRQSHFVCIKMHNIHCKMRGLKFVLCVILLNSYICIAENEPAKREENFADEIGQHAKDVAQGLGELFDLSPQQRKILEQFSVFFGRSGAHAVQKIRPTGSSLDEYAEMASHIGEQIGKEFVKIPIMGPFISPVEKKVWPYINSQLFARFIKFLSQIADIGKLQKQKSP